MLTCWDKVEEILCGLPLDLIIKKVQSHLNHLRNLEDLIPSSYTA